MRAFWLNAISVVLFEQVGVSVAAMTVSGAFDVILLAPTVAAIGHLLIATENVLRTSNTPLSSVAEANLLSIVSSNYLASVNTL